MEIVSFCSFFLCFTRSEVRYKSWKRILLLNAWTFLQKENDILSRNKYHSIYWIRSPFSQKYPILVSKTYRKCCFPERHNWNRLHLLWEISIGNYYDEYQHQLPSKISQKTSVSTSNSASRNSPINCDSQLRLHLR